MGSLTTNLFRLCRFIITAIVVAGLLSAPMVSPIAAQKLDLAKDLNKEDSSVSLTGISTESASKMSASSFSEAKTLASVATATGSATTSTNTTPYYFLNVEFKTSAGRRLIFTDLKKSNLVGAYVVTAIDRFAGIFLDRDSAWDALRKNPNVAAIEFGPKVQAPPPPIAMPSTMTSMGIPESIVRGGFQGLTGKSVIIAIIDTGIDFRHPDFISYSETGLPTSRIKYLWDTGTEFRPGRGSVAPVKFPNGTSIGTLYTKDHLTRELRSSSFNIPSTDSDGHGTACASVAAGNGNADKTASGLKRTDVIGVAPDADIIGVRLGKNGLENGYLINAIAEWVSKVAGKTPFVISGSFGSHYSGHDGQLIEERELAARFPLTSPGRAIVFAAGNEGNDSIHSKVSFSKQDKVVSWVAMEETIIKMYFDSADQGISITGTKATPIGSAAGAANKPLTTRVNPITGQLEASLIVKKGFGGIWFENINGKAGEVHLYFMNDSQGTFSPEYTVASHLVGSPGAMSNAITVGSYDWNDNFHSGGKATTLFSVCRDSKGIIMPFEIGWLSCYSSPGPTRNGQTKPDIVAPGEWFPSANARENGKSVGNWAKADSTGLYRAMNGTSAATPYVSGIVALMLQKKPTLTLGEIKRLINTNATKTGLSPFSGRIPHNSWGNGKLDRSSIERILGQI